MVMVVGEGGNNASAELGGLRMGQFQHRYVLQMVVQEPGVIDQGLQDQRLAAGHRAALAAHDRTGRQLRAGRLVGAGRDHGGSARPRAAPATGSESAGPSLAEAVPWGKTAA